MTLTAEFAVDEPGSCPVAAASAESDAPVSEVSRASLSGDGPVTEEFALSSPSDATNVDGVRSVAATDEGGIYRFERDPERDCVCERIERVAGPAVDVTAEDGTLLVEVRVEELADVRSVVDRLRESFGGVRVRRLTALDDAADPDDVLPDDDGLTDRQREVLRTAYDMGYFRYPKRANAGEVAEALDVSRSTFAEHVAAALGKVLSSRVRRPE